MKSIVKFIKICEKISDTGFKGKCIDKFFLGLLKTIKPRAKIIDKNLKIVYPESSEDWRISMRKNIYENLAWTLTEILALQKNPAQAFDWIKKIDGENYINDLFEQKKGAILLTGHFGNWELLGSWYAQNAKKNNYKLHVIFQEIHDKDISDYVHEMRQKNFMIPLAKETSATEFARLLRNGAHIAILNDVSWNRKLILPFMGKDCTVSSGPAVLAMLGGVPIVPICINRNSPFNHNVKIYEPFYVPDKKIITNQEERIKITTLKCNQALEKIILNKPELWFWLHNRWK